MVSNTPYFHTTHFVSPWESLLHHFIFFPVRRRQILLWFCLGAIFDSFFVFSFCRRLFSPPAKRVGEPYPKLDLLHLPPPSQIYPLPPPSLLRVYRRRSFCRTRLFAPLPPVVRLPGARLTARCSSIPFGGDGERKQSGSSGMRRRSTPPSVPDPGPRHLSFTNVPPISSPSPPFPPSPASGLPSTLPLPHPLLRPPPSGRPSSRSATDCCM